MFKRSLIIVLTCIAALAVAIFTASCASLPGRGPLISSGTFYRPDLGAAEHAVFDKYRQLIPKEMQQQNVPGLSLAVVDENGILWKEAYGCTDTDCRMPVTPDTLFSVQSTSKSVTATAVMFALQEGLVDLDTPVSHYLPNFHVKSVFEEHPEDKITLRHLLSHTAGFTHDPPVGNNNDLGPYSFEKHIQSIAETWLRFPVGAAYAYSNIGPDLAAYIVQVRAGEPFHQYVKERILGPLGMARSSFDLEQIRRDPNRAIGHSWPFAQAPFDMAFVGAGGFYTSADEMAEFIRFHINRGSVGGRSLLDAKWLDTMYAPHFSASATKGYGLGIAHGQIDTIPDLSHGGGGVGFISDMMWYPDLRLGIILLTNSTDHNLQGRIAGGIIDDLVDADGTVYHNRLAALQGHFPSEDNKYPLAIQSNNSHSVPELASSLGRADEQRWASYAGLYRIKTWNLVTELWPFEERNGKMYLNGTRMEELKPGVFFTPDGEAFDLTGPVPLAWSGIYADKVKNGMTPVKQGILGLCALVLLSALVVPPGSWLANRLQRRSHPSQSPSSRRLARTMNSAAAFTAVMGLLSLAAIIAFPVALYQDKFALDANLGLEVRLMLSLPLGLGLGAVIMVALSIAAWRRSDGSLLRREYYSAVTFAAVILTLLLYSWNLVAFGF